MTLGVRSSAALRAENLFLRKPLALLPRASDQASPSPQGHEGELGVAFEAPGAWKDALTIVKPDPFIRWHRQAFRLFWGWKSKSQGGPRLPADLQKLIVEMSKNNPTWGGERIAAELLLKLGIRVSPRTVRRYLPENSTPGKHISSQRWMRFVRNQAQGILARDFFVTVTASFRVLYVFVILEVGTRRIAHFDVTDHPTGDWTLQQFREVIAGGEPSRFLIHDLDSIYSSELDSALKSMR